MLRQSCYRCVINISVELINLNIARSVIGHLLIDVNIIQYSRVIDLVGQLHTFTH